MLNILRHYLPLRKALLITSETVFLTLVVALGMTAHLLFDPDQEMLRRVAIDRYSHADAVLRCLFGAFQAALIGQGALAFNELYEFRRSAGRVERFAGFVGSAGLALLAVVSLVLLCNFWRLDSVLDFPGLTLSQTVQVLVFSLSVGFFVLYLWRALFHRLITIWGFEERVLVLGSGRVARTLVEELTSRDSYRVVGVLPDPAPSERRDTDHLGGAMRFGDHGGPAGRQPAEVTPLVERRSRSNVQVMAKAQTEIGQERSARPLPMRPVTKPQLDDSELPLVGTLPGESLLQLAQRLNADDIVVSLEDRRGTMPTEELLRCRLAGLVVEEGEAIYERVTGKIAVEAMRPSYLIFNRGFVQHPFSEIAKRTFDIACALFGILLTWPLMAITAVLVKLDSPGPAFFRQERSGRFGQPIVVNKFRSMRTDAEKATGPVWAQENDPRITRVGRFIRKTRLDELPQLFNVLGGSMSMVGPRPERPHFIAELSQQIPYYHQRHIVKPGLTGWAQIKYPYGNTVEDALQKLQYDLFYIKYHSIPFDISICVQTIRTVLLRKGT
ncbi:TIGR03013 family XrtA/PEP-CTERM system glycosyltransferase [Engelhardtia mirabilis]|uniref:UDP-N-acetylgalactosamine-undecaprenyl-phosphate N-acetylgalactosaminephosphotransferase n=1 Tax=Engelhardtia mirabilis TaxID=2528011 RepID=A0A518BJK5_9BACT|nr:UDP-N-acetylgalactosamine-undecaprenyl-phosphate N-acetylgalactosaminephosphotransferase [Planctomycetes bacterium Pla133]QDV01487.1 UDP-N-acetylgalactosamine-undecaprenyl-phosphate N-acetylgalactosaminephosphotransferase [Planctomycetes bacterium Pla86]